MAAPGWWSAPWEADDDNDPDAGWASVPDADGEAWPESAGAASLDDDAILKPLEAQFGQVRSRVRVRDLAEVFTHQREVDAMLDQIPDAFDGLDVKFLEPSCGSGNFLTEILRRKLRLVTKAACVSKEHYEHRLLRALASIYGVDISPENIAEARGRMAHVVLEHYQTDANTVEPTVGFLNAAALILGDNVVVGDTLNAADQVELCDWRPAPSGFFQRVWSRSLVPIEERDLFWAERVQDAEPVHYSALVAGIALVKPKRRTTRSSQ
ncbi:hypothetical protein [Cyanobium gracile]|uniref:site-specific DNA-methyltransferase (adenine-specific) n=1 Tax=Cyanobium gracile UHCC 0281 TaxID=3110309 RepID=A0ABU5SZ96_9CYAN|nr:hypothetical protein [Cyanobium gracile]MEA5443352.1 hypothetical protein [Cyanobium gracile UHCC 0281]